jgi:hypothetical protein
LSHVSAYDLLNRCKTPRQDVGADTATELEEEIVEEKKNAETIELLENLLEGCPMSSLVSLSSFTFEGSPSDAEVRLCFAQISERAKRRLGPPGSYAWSRYGHRRREASGSGVRLFVSSMI